MRFLLSVALVLAAVGSANAANCNDMHIIGVTTVASDGTAQGLFDKMLGESICVQVQLIEIDTDLQLETPADYDVRILIVDSNGDTVETCCWTGEPSPGNSVPFYMGPPGWTCCYALSPDDPIGTYTIYVGIFADDGNCEIPCVPGSWNHAVTQVTGVVPVELSAFEAAVSGATVTIRWETRSENDNLGFFVLRSSGTDGDYVRLGEMIPAQGSSSTGATYSFTDRPGTSGAYFYRLEDVATDGLTTLHNPVRVVTGDTATWGEIKASFDK
ncbi:hypothetical protein JXA88_11915 [Candidatus Fermentibacteria bacterium]|nr:hypothetical protein [Candidatus Fermentibacteria bacterium]